MLNQMMEWLGLLITQPRKAFEKMKDAPSFLPGTLFLLFFIIFSALYNQFTLSLSFEGILHEIPEESRMMFEWLFHSSSFYVFLAVFMLVSHFFQTSFYLLWFQFFGAHGRGFYLWNVFAFANFPYLLVHLLGLIMIVAFGLNEWMFFGNIFSFAALIWSLYLIILGLSIEMNIRRLKVLGIFLLPWIIIFALVVIFVVWMFASVAGLIIPELM